MKVLIFNVRHSRNLGDGVLALCLENELRRAAPGIAVETIDLAGRGRPAGDAGGARLWTLGVLEWLPVGVRRFVVALALARRLKALKRDWRRRIEAADAVVIGGGNLFQDDDLNFPLKVAAVLECARLAGRPVGVFAVGVSGRWSARAARLFGALRDCSVFHVSARDRAAAESWRCHFAGWRAARIVPDPGLLARDLVAARQAPPPRAAPSIGICVTHPMILRRHGAEAAGAIPLTRAADYGALARSLAGAGCRVTLFTNGAAEDQRFLQRVARDVTKAGGDPGGAVGVAPGPGRPEDLVALIAAFDAVVAHRLHACIIAYSLAIPHVGLGWDRKVLGFFRAVGRERHVLTGRDATGERIAVATLAALREGIADEAHARHFVEARAGVALLARDLAAATGAGIAPRLQGAGAGEGVEPVICRSVGPAPRPAAGGPADIPA